MLGVCTNRSGEEPPEMSGVKPLATARRDAGCPQPPLAPLPFNQEVDGVSHSGAGPAPGHASLRVFLLTVASCPLCAGARLTSCQRTGNSRLQNVVEKSNSWVVARATSLDFRACQRKMTRQHALPRGLGNISCYSRSQNCLSRKKRIPLTRGPCLWTCGRLYGCPP